MRNPTGEGIHKIMLSGRRLVKLALAFAVLSAAAAFGQCSNTSYSNGFTCIQGKLATGGSNTNAITVTMGSNFTAGHQLVVFGYACFNSSCSGTIGNATGMGLVGSDGASDTFTASASTPFSLAGSGLDTVKMGIWVVKSAVGGNNTITMTCSGGSAGNCSFVTVWVSEWTGIDNSSPFDKDAGINTASTATSGSLSLAAGTNATDLIVGAVTTGSNPAMTPGSGFTEISEDSTGIEHEGKSVTNGTSTQSCGWSWTGSTKWDALCVSLKAGAVASNPTSPAVVY